MHYKRDLEKYEQAIKKASKKININFYPDPCINTQTLKIDTEMALSMTTGYRKGGQTVKTCIMSSHSGPRRANALQNDFESLPKLITHNTIKKNGGDRPLSGLSKRPLSRYGIDIKEHVLNKFFTERDPFRYKYIASLVAKYHIVNKMEVWKALCHSDIFDIWEPEAPYNNIYGKQDPLVLLMRVYELKDDYPTDYIEPNGVYSHRIFGDTIIPLKEPVIDDENFLEIHRKLDRLLINQDALEYKEIYIPHDNIEDCTFEIEKIKVFNF